LTFSGTGHGRSRRRYDFDLRPVTNPDAHREIVAAKRRDAFQAQKLEGMKSVLVSSLPRGLALRVPALFLFGDKDQLIPVEESVVIIRRVLAEDGHHDFTIREFPNDDHVMRLTAGETIGEIDPEYLKTMRGWLAAHVRNSP
jgi:pimeloyl-ACP methyl ester carboxylesterase